MIACLPSSYLSAKLVASFFFLGYYYYMTHPRDMLMQLLLICLLLINYFTYQFLHYIFLNIHIHSSHTLFTVNTRINCYTIICCCNKYTRSHKPIIKYIKICIRVTEQATSFITFYKTLRLIY